MGRGERTTPAAMSKSKSTYPLTPIKQFTPVMREVIELLSYMLGSEVAREMGISRQRVSYIKRRLDITYPDTKLSENVRRVKMDYPDHLNFEDTGCLDGRYPSCLNCPLPECRYDK